MLEGNEQLDAQKVSDSVREFLIRYSIDETAALALQSLPLEQQQEVTGQITRATNPSAVLLSRIKRLKQGPSEAAATPVIGASLPLVPLDDSNTRAAVEAFLERHCINADACQSIWELSPEQQRLVMATDLGSAEDAFDALMDRISEILQGAVLCLHAKSLRDDS